ncbi:Spermidine/putrescine-binding periplasmic protein precursor [Marinomonas spartinae]|uniref:Spermidine/putrescine-binding periplasmic protein n=1 Tax=Marinomonas spartinae TaxID=1792290 RepID=A0A1A8SZD1_9GAMM|nr:extracellular solute-binding protein [Marinomonas spartinae]SBS24546.1 Spermidine/putrescine-binding periplasmic protein precursor [Marinomonas spartinae]SBS36206.1 Spermidine/putrescine-binding periplasmic protein precursor [Marinomonas spartinae]
MTLSRRQFIKGASVVGAVATSPFMINRAVAASKELRIYAWAGYITDEMLKDFKEKTGINATFTPYGTNDELMNSLRATDGTGFDIIMPTVDRVPGYVAYDLVQPLDKTRIKWDGCLDSAISGSKVGGVVKGERYFAPSDWGTEAIAYNKKEATVSKELSYGDLWLPENAGGVTVRAHSALVGIGLWLEKQGKLPFPLLDSYKTEKAMRANFDVILKTAVKYKGSIAQFWSTENEAQGAFRTNGAIIGQTWDSTAFKLQSEGEPIVYRAPKEGALAWMEGFVVPKNANNVDSVYEFINWYYTPEAGAMFVKATGYNSTAKGAEALLPQATKDFFNTSYTKEDLANLWWWPIQEPWYVALRNEYQDRYLSA